MKRDAGAEPGEDLRDWVADQGPFVPDLMAFAGALGRRLVAAGLPLSRLALNVQLLHPRFQARTLWWEASADRAGHLNWPRTIQESETYKRSPMKAVIGEGRVVRYRLDSAAAKHPIDHELRESGAVEYFACPLPGPVGLPHALSLALFPPGITDRQVDEVLALVPALAEICDTRTLLETARSVSTLWASHYLWHEGEGMEVGDAQHVRGVFVGLTWEDFGAQALEGVPAERVARLNRWYDIGRRMVNRFEGEILDTSGARLLAFFSSPHPRSDRAACVRALDAARSIRAAAFDLAELDRQPARLPQIRAAIDLRTALYGPTGSETRVDFVVAGDVRDRLRSLLAQARAHGLPLVATGDAAAHFAGAVRRLDPTPPGGCEAFALTADPDADTLL